MNSRVFNGFAALLLRGGTGKRVRKIVATICLCCLLLGHHSVSMAEVSLTGLEDDAKTNVELMLSLNKENCSSPHWKIQRLYDQAKSEIEQGLHALGYYQPVIQQSLTFKADCWTAKFDVQAGPQVIITSVKLTFTGDAEHDASFKKLDKQAQKSVGKPLRHDQYEQLKSKIATLAMSKGYLDGEFTTKKLLVDPPHNSAAIELVYAAKKRVQLGKIEVKQSILQPDFVDKFLAIKPGQFYSGDRLAKTHQALVQSGYFSRIDIQAGTETADHKVPITISLEPKKKYHYQIGVGYDTDIGPLLSGAFSNRPINDRGHYITSELNLSPVLSTAEMEYRIPLAAPITDFFSFGAGLKREDTQTYKSLSATISARLNHALTHSWKQTLYLDYSYEDFSTQSDPNTVRTLLLVPGASWLKSVSDNPVRPKKAYRVKIDVDGSYRMVISDVSFLQAAFSGVWSHPVPWLGGNFIGRSELGAMLVEHFVDLPTTYRYYAGGINSVRGYNFKELGPKDKLGNVEGGQFLAVFSAEYEHPVFSNWGLAGFIDAGNAFNTNSIQIKSGAGIGLRWYSPFGPVRLDFAVPLNNASSSFQIHFAAGTRL